MPGASAPVGGGPKKLMSGRSFFRADLPVGDGTVLPARRIFRLSGRPMNYMLFSWAEPGHGSQSPRDPGFVNPTLCKLKNYQSGPLDADTMDGVRGGIFLRLSPLTPSIGSTSSGPDW